ncbi:MAG: cupin domain-containing protein [Actinobacteria bacterium]|nr:cupin domain-containing protein [Actinomycetota bacterium]
MTDHDGTEALDFRPSLRQTMFITGVSEETDGRISRVEIELEGDQGGPPKHVHPQQREIYTVEEGELTVTLDGDRHVVPAGESIEIPAGSLHGFANPSDQPVRFTADHRPALRFEEYIRLVHRTVQGRKATLPVIMRIVRIESSYPETILPPPGPPRLVSKVLAGLGKLAGFPTGEELTASS